MYLNDLMARTEKSMKSYREKLLMYDYRVKVVVEDCKCEIHYFPRAEHSDMLEYVTWALVCEKDIKAYTEFVRGLAKKYGFGEIIVQNP